MSRIMIPVLPRSDYPSWPKYPEKYPAPYRELGQALVAKYPNDAHFAAYSCPDKERRLASDKVFEPPNLERLGGCIKMVAAFFDVDGPNHVCSEEWYAEEIEKLVKLLEDHPDLFIYRTRGGYRIVGVLPEPIKLRSKVDALELWTKVYLSWVAYFRRRYGIVADPVGDWTRLFRAPHATRKVATGEVDENGKEVKVPGTAPEDLETIGDPHAIGTWDPLLTEEDMAEGVEGVDKRCARARKSTAKASKKKSRTASAPSKRGDHGVLYQVLVNRGDVGDELEPGAKWCVKCPGYDEHSNGATPWDSADSSTVLFAPSEDNALGWIQCSHTSRGHDKYTLQDWLMTGALQQSEIDAAQKTCGRRPVIRITNELHVVVDQAADVLGSDLDIYQRNGRLEQVIRVAKNEADASFLEGTPTIRPVLRPTLIEKLTRHADWEKFDGRAQGFVPAMPTMLVADTLLERGCWRTVRPLTGITEAPMFRGNGEIMQEPGYDRVSGFLYLPSCEFPKVPAAPTFEDVRAAAEALREVWADFEWRGAADLAVMVALVFTMLSKVDLGDTPVTAVESTTAGGGKGLSTDAAMIIGTGRPANKQTYSSDPVELEKILGGYALRGASFVNFDDVGGEFGGAPLCKVITCGGCNSFRILGRSQTSDLPWNAIVTVTGNNIEFQGDIVRRVCIARLEPSVEKPELRTGFKHERLLEWVLENRPRLVVAALTILRAWHLDGRKTYGCATLGSFEKWSSVVPPACVFAGFADPLACCPSTQGDEAEPPARLALRTVIEQWHEVAANDGATIASVVRQLWPQIMTGSVDRFDGLRSALCVLAPPKFDGLTPDVLALSRVFTAKRGVVVGRGKLMSAPGKGGVQKWRVQSLAEGGVGGVSWVVQSKGGEVSVSEEDTRKAGMNDKSIDMVERTQLTPPTPPTTHVHQCALELTGPGAEELDAYYVGLRDDSGDSYSLDSEGYVVPRPPLKRIRVPADFRPGPWRSRKARTAPVSIAGAPTDDDAIPGAKDACGTRSRSSRDS